MSNETQHKSSKYEAINVLNFLRGRYSRFAFGEVELFAPVYYPVAIVEMQLEERTFEDFETVHLAVLRLMELGITDYKLIGATLGLSPNYVFKILRILTGFGHINGAQVTELGRQSLAEEKKITTNRTRQKFQVDALTGQFLKMDGVVSESMLTERDKTRLVVAHIDHLDGVTVESLNKQLTGEDSGKYLYHRSDILHANVTAITDVRCVEIKYAQSYMLKMKDAKELFVFAKLYDRTKKEMKDRFSWGMLRGIKLDRFYTPTGFDPKDNLLAKMYKLLSEQREEVEWEEEIPKALCRIYPFEEDDLVVDTDPPAVWISTEGLGVYRDSLLTILCELYQTGEYTFTGDYLYGTVCKLKTTDRDLRALAKLVAQKADKHGLSTIKQKLREHFETLERYMSVADEITQVLDELD